MKFLILFSLSFVVIASFAQKSLPVIKASSKNAFIVEGESGFKQSWGVNPAIQPDVHVITKTIKPKWVRFYTDIDSIKVKMKPNETFDFIVLLNGKDSCYTRLKSLPLQNYSNRLPVTHDTIPFVLTEFNNIKIASIINKVDTLDLIFDSGTAGVLLNNSAIKQKIQPLKNGPNNTFQVGNLSWGGQEVYPVELSGQGSDGRFGWDLFDGRIVEIDFDKSLFIVHSKIPKVDKAYAKFDMEYIHEVFFIYTDLQIKDKKYRNRFLFDNGYQRTIMLDTLLMNEQDYPKDLPVIKKVIMKNGMGKEIPVITVNNERLNIGKYTLFNIPVQLLATANPARVKAHILGNEVLKRFNTILDFKNNIAYLKPNSLVNLPYKDAN